DAGLRNQASLYHHFSDKRALYEAALARGVAPIVALMEQSGGGWLDPAEVERNVDRLLDYLIEHPHLPRRIQRAGLDGSRFLRAGAAAVARACMRLSEIAPSNPAQFAAGPPHEAFKLLRREAPLFWNRNGGGEGFWALTRYRDIWNVSLDPRTFSTARRGTI